MLSRSTRGAGPGTRRRRGISLLEVLIALAIFLMSVIVLGRLVILAGERGQEAQYLSEATQICQSKLAEVLAGAVPLTPQSDVPLDEDSSYTWSLECSPAEYANLWDVTVRVGRKRPDGSRVECELSQRVLDPSVRGSTFDAAALQSSSTNSSSSSGGSGTGSSSNSGNSAGGP
jgi:Tfp pilus assembly protein PilV